MTEEKILALKLINEKILAMYGPGANVPMNDKTNKYWIPPNRGPRPSRKKKLKHMDYVYCCRMCGWDYHWDPDGKY